jgi:hypothetical protein
MFFFHQAYAENQDLDYNVTLSDAEGPSDQTSERVVKCVSLSYKIAKISFYENNHLLYIICYLVLYMLN